MGHQTPLRMTPDAWLRDRRPDHAVAFFDGAALARTAARFQAGFPGLVTYAVKANPAPYVLAALVKAGVTAFDVASPREIAQVRAVAPQAALHYHNPIRSPAEIRAGVAAHVQSWSIDRPGELAKMTGLPPGSEIAVRLALPVAGAAYDFGGKFGAAPDLARDLLRQVVQMGLSPSMTFHPGTQCTDPAAWGRYIKACATIATEAGVSLQRLNVGGGFAAQRCDLAPNLEASFERIATELRAQSGGAAPALVCEPGRAMVADAVTLALRVKAVSQDAVFLNDGIYGTLADWRDMGAMRRITVMHPDGPIRRGAPDPRVLFGPTCDSLDRVPGLVDLPSDLCEGDYLILPGMGAYSNAMATRFNGYGDVAHVCIGDATPEASGLRRMAV